VLPCLLSSETIIEHLLHRGITLLEGYKKLTEQFMKEVEDIMNDEIFGHNGCQSNWRFPVNDDGSMGQIKFANWRARRVIERIKVLLSYVFQGITELLSKISGGM
jgi:hypothetical protein